MPLKSAPLSQASATASRRRCTLVSEKPPVSFVSECSRSQASPTVSGIVPLLLNSAASVLAAPAIADVIAAPYASSSSAVTSKRRDRKSVGYGKRVELGG